MRFRNFRIWLIALSIALISACGSQDTVGGNNGNSDLQASSKTVKTSNSSLLASLAALYPNGQMSEQQKAMAAKELAQNPAALRKTIPASASINSKSASVNVNAQLAVGNYGPVSRIQNTTLSGSYFFTIYDSERDSALVLHPEWRLEGTAFYTSRTASTGLNPVHRFQNKINGSYLYTIYDTERADIVANYSDFFAYEGISWYASQVASTGLTPLYRFRNKLNGTYLFTSYESEKASIVVDYAAVFELEGIAYYVSQTDPAVAALSGAVLGNGFSDYAVVGKLHQQTIGVAPRNRGNTVTSLSISNLTTGGGQPSITAAGLVSWTPTEVDFAGTKSLNVTAIMATGAEVVLTAPVDVRKYRQVLRTTLLPNEATYADAEGRYLVKVKKANSALALQGDLIIGEYHQRNGVFTSEYAFTVNESNSILELIEIPNPVITSLNTANGQNLNSQVFKPHLNASLIGLVEIPGAVPGAGSKLKEGTNIYTSREAFAYGEKKFTNFWVQPTTDNSVAAFNYFGTCGATTCTRTGTPVILIHGFTPDAFDAGGSGTWGNLAQAVTRNGSDVFEMRWKTQMRFEEAAAKLADFSRYVALKTGKKPMIVAHSFGGIVAHLAIRNKGIHWNGTSWVPSPLDMSSIVSRVLTINSPLSGIQSILGSDYLPASNNSITRFARDQDDLMIDGQYVKCYSITCAQAGSNYFRGNSFPNIAYIDPAKQYIENGESILNLRINSGTGVNPISSVLPTAVPTLALVGIRDLPSDFFDFAENDKYKLGDGLISLLGQAMDPRDFADNTLGSMGTPTFHAALSLARINGLGAGGCLSHQGTTFGVHNYILCTRSAHSSGIELGHQQFNVNDYGAAHFLEQTEMDAGIIHPLQKVLFDGFPPDVANSQTGLLREAVQTYAEAGIEHSIIHGTVSNGVTGTKISGASVTALLLNKVTGEPAFWYAPLGTTMAITDSFGNYTLDAGNLFDRNVTLLRLSDYSIKLKIQFPGYDKWEDRVIDLDPDVLKNAQLQTPGALVNATGTVIDGGLAGSVPVAGANIYLAAGSNLSQGRLILNASNNTNTSRNLSSDANGRFTITGVKPGDYSALVLKTGYRKLLQGNVRITANGVVTFSIARDLLPGESSITLRWANSAVTSAASDLDSHLIRLSGTSINYHISYAARTVVGSTDNLDRDDTSYEGPETISFTRNTAYNYVYYVHNFSGGTGKSIPGSFPSVTLMTGTVETTYVPPSMSGTIGRYWRVFDIVNGQVVRCVNSCLQDVQPTSLGAQSYSASSAATTVTEFGSAPLSSDVFSSLSNLPNK